MASIPCKISYENFSASKHGKGSVANEVAITMGIPENIVELAWAVRLQEHGTDFQNAMQLYKLAVELMGDPQKQKEIIQKISKAEQAVKEEEKASHKDAWQLEKDGEVLKVKAAVRDAVEMQGKAEGEAVKARPADRAQLKNKVQKLARENHLLRQRKLCRKCKEVDLSSSGVTFLPCGHFITCETCSETYDNCPACAKSIMGTVRTFLS